MKKGIGLILIITLVTAMMSGCGQTGSVKEGAGDAGLTKRTDLKIILPADFTTLDPQKLDSSPTINFAANIFDPLVRLNENNEAVPMLAKEWEISDDGLEYTFTLKDGIKFHNGEILTTEDVLFTISRFTTETWFEWASFMIDKGEIIDDKTIKIILKFPYANFFGFIESMYIVNKKATTEANGEISDNPIGTGPYKFVKWDRAQQIILTANEDYFGGASDIKDLIFMIIPDSNTAFVALETGEADLSFDVSAVNIDQAKKNERLSVDSTISTYFYYVSFNSEKIKDKRIRQALSYAVDRNSINTIVTEGEGILSDIFLVEGQEGYTTDVMTYEYNPEKAKQLLDDAGANNLKLDFFYGESTINNKLGQVLQSMFMKVGVELELKPVETGTWWQLIDEGDYQVTRGGYPMEPNTDSPYYDMFHSDGTYNLSRIRNAEIDKLLESARVEMNEKKRDEMYVRINQIMAQEAYFIPTYFLPSNIVYSSSLKGVKALRNQKYMYADFYW